MATPKSPFYIIQDFISPKHCEQIVDNLGFYTPDVDQKGKPIKMMRHHEPSELLIYEQVKPLIPEIEEYYEIKHRATESVSFEFYAEGTTPKPVCENSIWINKKWTRTVDRDISAVLFLSDYQENVPFDSDYEVYGGKLEFPQHGFGFNPERGTLIIYPSTPHFINAVSDIMFGDLFVAKFHLSAFMPYLYDPEKFPGDYRTWFKGLY